MAKASIRRPRVAVDFAQTVLAVDRSGIDRAYPGETVSLEIAPAFQGLGLGFLLLQTAVTELRRAGCTAIKARILESNHAVERLHPPLGFRKGPSFRLHGRDWTYMLLGPE
jgi:L-amino acid N-acyltransferase YncA